MTLKGEKNADMTMNNYIDNLNASDMYLLLLQSALQPLVGFRPAQLSLSILSRKVLESAVVSGMSNPQLGVIRIIYG
jgi:hypothetical protein